MIMLNTYRKWKSIQWWKKFKREREKVVENIYEFHENDENFKEELKYLKKYGADYFPYFWSRDKNFIWNIKCGGGRDRDDRNMPYVIRNNKRLYMELRAYSQLMLEQHKNSPHRYFTDNFYVAKGECFVDIGAAEGMISLDVIENAKRILLIECDEIWLKRLGKTFEPYLDKVKIIQKYVSELNDENNITLDELLKDVTEPVLLKIDVEGMEKAVLNGAQEVLHRDSTKVAICTYHREGDDVEFQKYFKNLGYKTEFSEGYMAMVNETAPPYFRKALLRAWKE